MKLLLSRKTSLVALLVHLFRFPLIYGQARSKEAGETPALPGR